MQAFIFDLDNTLYSQELNIFPIIDARINAYMSRKLGMPQEEVDELRRYYWNLYGVTLKGLMLHHGIDPEDFLREVHDLDLAGILKPNPKLRQTLSQLQADKFIFTNASQEHARNVLGLLDLQDLFQDIFDIRIADYQPKPYQEPYVKILKHLNLQAWQCVMVDDLPDNLKTAKDLGMQTVLIGDQDGHPYIDCCVPRACQILKAARTLSSRSRTI